MTRNMKLCALCGERPALSRRAGKPRSKLCYRRNHDLCQRCWHATCQSLGLDF